MVSRERITERLLVALPGAHVELEDTTGTSDHFDAVVVSAAFAGKSRIEQHKMVYAALGELMVRDIHALKLKTATPETWSRETRENHGDTNEEKRT